MTNDLKQNANAYGDVYQCELRSTKTSVNKRTILTTRKVRNVNSKVQICVKTTAENGRCVQCEWKMSDKSEINADCVGYGMFSHFGDATAAWPTHYVIHSSTAIATHCRSRSLQAVSQSQWPKVGVINDYQTNCRPCNWRIKMCGKQKTVNRRLTLNIKLIGD